MSPGCAPAGGLNWPVSWSSAFPHSSIPAGTALPQADCSRRSLGASFTRARVEGTGTAAELNALRPAQTPNVTVAGNFAWERRGQVLSLTIRHVGAQFEDDLNEDRLKPATTLDIFAAWPLTRRLQIVARGENLFDKLVEAGIGADGSVERATPRTLWLGLRFDGGEDRR